jgi:hypothetical protein
LQKVIGILLLMVLITDCSVSKPGSRSIDESKKVDGDSIRFIDIKEKNLTEASFFIQKAEVEIIENEEKHKFVASIKFNYPDSFLVSIRSISGIEAVRIFSTKDTILINERISKTFFYGSKEAARNKYGFNSILFPILLGDIVVNMKSELKLYQCTSGLSGIETFIEGYKVDYSVNCSEEKVEEGTITKEIDTKPILIKYYDFKKFSGYVYPRKVKIRDLKMIDIINIKINRIEIPWTGNIFFVPGNNYEQIEIK